MQLKFIEVTNGQANWGKFALGTFTAEEWQQRAVIDGGSMIAGRGWTPRHVWVLDLQTGEGALLKPGGSAKYDLDKHAIWVCPMFEPMLEWLYDRVGDAEDVAAAITALPDHVDLPDAPFALSGYRRPGPKPVAQRLILHAIDPDEDSCVMPWSDFVASCQANAFTDDDGFGDLATDAQVSNVSVCPSQAVDPSYQRPKWATHVSWYNR